MRWRGDPAVNNVPYRATLGLCASLLLFHSRCRNKSELVERQNHQLEVALRDARSEVMRTHAYNEALERELAGMKTTPCPDRPLPGVAAPRYSLKSITLTRQTGGVTTDGHLGDDALQVVIEPQDVDGHAIKVPGSLFVEASEINTEGNKRPISSWVVSPEQLRSRWKSGLWTNGYFVTLPWKTWPETTRLHIAVKLILPDSRAFEDEKQITIKPRPQQQRTVLPVDPMDGPALETPLPPPRKLDVPPPQGPALDRGARRESTSPV